MNPCMELSKEPRENLLEITSEFSKIVIYKVNIKKANCISISPRTNN